MQENSNMSNNANLNNINHTLKTKIISPLKQKINDSYAQMKSYIDSCHIYMPYTCHIYIQIYI